MGKKNRRLKKELKMLPPTTPEVVPDLESVTLIFNRKAQHKIMHWVNKAQGECSGLGKILRSEDGSFRVEEVILLPQKNTGSSTDIEPADVGKAMFELKDVPGDLNFWWHSHANMGVFWSSTDKDTIKLIGQAGYVVATVFNKRGEQRNALYLSSNQGDKPIRIFLDNIKHELISTYPQSEFDAWDKEFDEKCKHQTFVPAHTQVGRTNYKWHQEEWGEDVIDKQEALISRKLDSKTFEWRYHWRSKEMRLFPTDSKGAICGPPVEDFLEKDVEEDASDYILRTMGERGEA